jgi:hypothetical protein
LPSPRCPVLNGAGGVRGRARDARRPELVWRDGRRAPVNRPGHQGVLKHVLPSWSAAPPFVIPGRGQGIVHGGPHARCQELQRVPRAHQRANDEARRG